MNKNVLAIIESGELLVDFEDGFIKTNYKQDVRDWWMKCENCQKRNFPLKFARVALKQYPVGVPFERVGIDILGPL